MNPSVVRIYHSDENVVESIREPSEAGEVTEELDIDYVWKRPFNREILKQSELLIARFEVVSARILPLENLNARKYVLYKIQVRMEGAEEATDALCSIERRYTELLSLYDTLRKEYSTVLAEIVFPKKRLLGNFSEPLIGERSMAFESFLDFIITVPILRESLVFLEFLQGEELRRACLLLDERRHEQAIPILENCFRVLSKIYLDKSKPVLLLLCRLVAATTGSTIMHANSQKWITLALRRFEHVSDVEILVLYVPLLQACVNYYATKGEDYQTLQGRLGEMGVKGIKVKGNLSLNETIHVLDPRSETA